MVLHFDLKHIDILVELINSHSFCKNLVIICKLFMKNVKVNIDTTFQHFSLETYFMAPFNYLINYHYLGPSGGIKITN